MVGAVVVGGCSRVTVMILGGGAVVAGAAVIYAGADRVVSLVVSVAVMLGEEGRGEAVSSSSRIDCCTSSQLCWPSQSQ